MLQSKYCFVNILECYYYYYFYFILVEIEFIHLFVFLSLSTFFRFVLFCFGLVCFQFFSFLIEHCFQIFFPRVTLSACFFLHSYYIIFFFPTFIFAFYHSQVMNIPSRIEFVKLSRPASILKAAITRYSKAFSADKVIIDQLC